MLDKSSTEPCYYIAHCNFYLFFSSILIIIHWNVRNILLLLWLRIDCEKNVVQGYTLKCLYLKLFGVIFGSLSRNCGTEKWSKYSIQLKIFLLIMIKHTIRPNITGNFRFFCMFSGISSQIMKLFLLELRGYKEHF